MKALMLSAAAIALTLTAAAPAFAAKKVIIVKEHHDRGMHRGMHHGPMHHHGAKVIIHR